jgi:Holliday junction resolvase
MTSPSKRKGDAAEREVEGILRDLLGLLGIRRALGAGRKDDVGDIHGIPNTVIQVVNRKSLSRAIREKLPEAERQREVAGVDFAATFCRLPGGKFIVVMTPEQWATLWREAQ